MHVLIARHGGEYKYAAWLREHETVGWSLFASPQRLEPVVGQALDVMFKPKATTDLTFSTRLAEEVMSDLIELPEQLLTSALGCEIEALCQEGRLEGKEDRWATVRRSHNRFEVFSFGLDDVFQPQTLRTKVAGFFEGYGWHTFGAQRPRDENHAPPYDRELFVRHGDGDGWLARQICPTSFPIFRTGPVIGPEAQARYISKLGQAKSKVRREKHAANLERFRTEALERAKQREAAT